jgi:hypothetical protein
MSSAKWLRVPGGHAYERKPVLESGRGHDRQRAVAARDPEDARSVRHRLVDERREAVAGSQNDRVDAALARQLGEVGALGLAAAGPRVDEEHGLRRRHPVRRIRAGPRA